MINLFKGFWSQEIQDTPVNLRHDLQHNRPWCIHYEQNVGWRNREGTVDGQGGETFYATDYKLQEGKEIGIVHPSLYGGNPAYTLLYTAHNVNGNVVEGVLIPKIPQKGTVIIAGIFSGCTIRRTVNVVDGKRRWIHSNNGNQRCGDNDNTCEVVVRYEEYDQGARPSLFNGMGLMSRASSGPDSQPGCHIFLVFDGSFWRAFGWWHAFVRGGGFQYKRPASLINTSGYFAQIEP